MVLVATTRLGEVAQVYSGYAFKSSDFGDVGVPVIKISNIRVGNIDLTGAQFIDRSYRSIDKKYHVLGGDLLISLTGSHLTQPNSVVGRVARHSHSLGLCFLNQRAGKIRVTKPDLYDQDFLYYVLSTYEMRRNIALMASGAASQANVSPSQVESLEIPLPPLPTQRKIAAILSAYDDLIENNTRRIKILEEMAQALYREWFVHFRFPGHEGVRLVESELGLVPEGWEVQQIGDVIETLGGGTPSTSNDEYWEDGTLMWFSPTDLTAAGTMFISSSAKRITQQGLRSSSAKLFPAYSVMMTSRATLGVAAINTTEACTNQGFITCVPNDRLSVYQIFFWIAENKEKIIGHASGATFKEISRGVFRKLPVVVPPNHISTTFTDVVSPVGKLLENLQSANANLRRTRDLLLPRLISGHLDVAELDIAA